MKNNNTKKLAACAVMVALGAVLSLIKVLQMPFGGSITLLSNAALRHDFHHVRP